MLSIVVVNDSFFTWTCFQVLYLAILKISCFRYRNREENLEVLEQSLNVYMFDFTRYLDFIQYVILNSDLLF